MNLRQFKKLSIMKIKQLKVEDGNILMMAMDMRKITPEEAISFYNIAKANLKKEIVPIIFPTDMRLSSMTKNDLIDYKYLIQKYIDKLGE